MANKFKVWDKVIIHDWWKEVIEMKSKIGYYYCDVSEPKWKTSPAPGIVRAVPKWGRHAYYVESPFITGTKEALIHIHEEWLKEYKVPFGLGHNDSVVFSRKDRDLEMYVSEETIFPKDRKYNYDIIFDIINCSQIKDILASFSYWYSNIGGLMPCYGRRDYDAAARLVYDISLYSRFMWMPVTLQVKGKVIEEKDVAEPPQQEWKDGEPTELATADIEQHDAAMDKIEETLQKAMDVLANPPTAEQPPQQWESGQQQQDQQDQQPQQQWGGDQWPKTYVFIYRDNESYGKAATHTIQITADDLNEAMIQRYDFPEAKERSIFNIIIG